MSGFFYVTGHGFTDEEVRRQYAIARAVFALPLEEKQKYLCDTANGDFRGYKPQATGALAGRDNDERYNIPKFTPEHARPHPLVIVNHWSEIRDFSLRVHNQVLLPLLRLFAHVLEIDEHYFVDRHRYEAPGLEYLRYMQYWPRTPADDARTGNIWARGHTDYNTLTFLFHQPVAGLQAQAPDGQWRHVRSPRDAIIVNIADALEFMSGGYLKSTVHRVVRPPADQAGRPRLSLIYFARPETNVVLQTIQSPLLQRLGLQKETEQFTRSVTAEGEKLRWEIGEYLFPLTSRMGTSTDRQGSPVPDWSGQHAGEGDHCRSEPEVLFVKKSTVLVFRTNTDL